MSNLLSMTTSVISPNTRLMPITAEISKDNHLLIGGLDTVELAARYGTPLWIMDYATMEAAADACRRGLESYKNSQVLYAGKAFSCTAMCHIVNRLGLGLDVVSEGELYTALRSGLPHDKIYLHGNNKTDNELKMALQSGIKIVVDSLSELTRLGHLAGTLGRKAEILMRVVPGVEPNTHHYIKTGQADSKFGVTLDHVDQFVSLLKSIDTVKLIGIHAHIGSQAHDVEPYLEIVDILADVCLDLKEKHGLIVEQLDVGGGVGIAYTEADKPLSLYEWTQAIAAEVEKCFKDRSLALPQLLVEPGRSIVGPAGVTLYRAGHVKDFANGNRYVALDGGMADNPRPATYNAIYTARIANRMDARLDCSRSRSAKTALVGRYCESGDIIVRDAGIPAETGDTIVVFGTGAYNYSMASNYNRTARPACILIKDGTAEVILERETNEDLIRQDRVPSWLLEPSSAPAAGKG